jgi:hypothetical protein
VLPHVEGTNAALWTLPEGAAEAIAEADLAVFRAVVARYREHLPALARTFALEAADRATAIFGMELVELEELAADVLVAVSTFVDEGAEGRTDGPGIAALRAKARSGARQGTPVEALVMGYHLGAKWFWNQLRASARPEEVPALDRVWPRLQSFTQDLVLVLTEASFTARQTPPAEQLAADDAAVAALLAGRGDPTSRWSALALKPVPPAGLDVLHAARDLLRRSVPGAVGQVRGDVALVLIPAEGRTPGGVLAVVRETLGTLLVIGGLAHPIPPAGVREAAGLATDLMSLAERTGRRTGVHGLGSLLIDYALDRQPELRQHLAVLVSDLPADLRATLELWVGNRDRKATAAALHVHPNTVGYRLKRIGELTGVDPTGPEGSLTLHAALVARRR